MTARRVLEGSCCLGCVRVRGVRYGRSAYRRICRALAEWPTALNASVASWPAAASSNRGSPGLHVGQACERFGGMGREFVAVHGGPCALEYQQTH